jgi:molybdate transport system substrate-binding protein
MLVHVWGKSRRPSADLAIPGWRAALLFLMFAMLAGFVVVPAQAQITVAAAADLNFALPELARKFEQQTGHYVRPVFGSSGNLFAQIQNGAPYDVFLSANTAYPQRLLGTGEAIAGSYASYAVGRLALYARGDSPLDLTKLGIHVLLAPSVHRIAIANPEHAPYGAAAVAALRHYGLYERLQSKLVLGENVSQAAQFVLSGNAQVALTALSVAQAQNGKYALIPAEAHAPIEQAAVVLKRSAHPAVATSFVRFLSSAEAREILQRFGFQSPAAATSANLPAAGAERH